MDSFTGGTDSSSLSSIGSGLRKMDRISADGGSAASRQKSCNACVRGKRRCDKRTPRCTRCAAKGLDCVYQRQPQQQQQPQQQPQQQHQQPLQHQQQSPAGASTATTIPSCASVSTVEGSCTTPEMPPEFDMSFDIESLSTTTGTNTSPESLQQDANMGLGCDPHSHHTHADLGFSIVDLMNGTGTGDGGLWDLSGFGDSGKMDLPPVPIAPSLQTEQPQSSHSQHLQPPQPIRDLSILQNEDQCIPADVCQVHDPRSKIGFIVKAISDMYRDFAQRREAPFLHPRLWSSQLPKTILTAFSAATAYSSQTPQTKGWTLKVLLDAVREVHRDGERATTHADRLARVQALLLLNSMRIFDGDLGMRAAAEREMSVFLAWVKDLIAVKNELEEGLPASAHMMRDKPPKSWDSWIMVECTRRTIMISFAIMCLVFVLKSEEAPPEFWEDGHSFTASRHLWEATSSVDFFRAWREKPQYCVTDMSFKEFWMYARPDDMDEFTRLMLTTQVGVDAIEHFMAGETNIPVPP
ncbi:hypothetical protein TGAMA5MH_09802 [Trichoderma gamsii]|uniref:Zn(2)-C6 fungal-type domain-containing protein n=1 Tax=Trichoderma gamsii TaxID=398673 RepID=A0A2K0SY95_9HYPO|nr:hypothetical protein TGAMA5MH_09802 [Trichoderma gamsii]